MCWLCHADISRQLLTAWTDSSSLDTHEKQPNVSDMERVFVVVGAGLWRAYPPVPVHH